MWFYKQELVTAPYTTIINQDIWLNIFTIQATDQLPKYLCRAQYECEISKFMLIMIVAKVKKFAGNHYKGNFFHYVKAPQADVWTH